MSTITISEEMAEEEEIKWFSKAEWMYVDSGADITLIPRSVGDLLGFEMIPPLLGRMDVFNKFDVIFNDEVINRD